MILAVQEQVSLLLKSLPNETVQQIKHKLFALANERGLLWAKCLGTLLVVEQYADKESGPVLLYEDASTVVNSEDLMAYINILQVNVADYKCSHSNRTSTKRIPSLSSV